MNFDNSDSFALDIRNYLYKEESKLDSGQKFNIRTSKKKFGFASLNQEKEASILTFFPGKLTQSRSLDNKRKTKSEYSTSRINGVVVPTFESLKEYVYEGACLTLIGALSFDDENQKL